MKSLKPIRLPEKIRGLKEWNPELLKETYFLPYLRFPDEGIHKVRQKLKKPLLKSFVPDQSGFKKVLLDPEKVESWSDFENSDKSVLKTYASDYKTEGDFPLESVELSVENWRPDEILKAVLPNDQEGLSSFSTVGHIAHVNLKDNLLDYKNVIGSILLLHKPIRTVVRKIDVIDNVFRNFKMEVIAGDPDFVVDLKECGSRFKFDFSKVFWNSRLNKEHENIVDILEKSKDIVVDVFAGVGPFVIPAALKKKPTLILANDLNPESYKYLNINKELNKIKTQFLTYNLDGREFLKTIFKAKLLEIMFEKSEPHKGTIRILMNLPAIAIEFCDVFPELLKELDMKNIPKIIVYVYAFSGSASPENELKSRLESAMQIEDLESLSTHLVRTVAPNKDMYRLTFFLNQSILCNYKSKRIKIS